MIPENTKDCHNVPHTQGPAPQAARAKRKVTNPEGGPREGGPAGSGLRSWAPSCATNPIPTSGGLYATCSLTQALLRVQKHLLQNKPGAAGFEPNPSMATLQTCFHSKATVSDEDQGQRVPQTPALSLSHTAPPPSLGPPLLHSTLWNLRPQRGADPRPLSLTSKMSKGKTKDHLPVSS